MVAASCAAADALPDGLNRPDQQKAMGPKMLAQSDLEREAQGTHGRTCRATGPVGLMGPGVDPVVT